MNTNNTAASAEYLAKQIKGWSEQGRPPAQQFYSAFKILQLSDEVSTHPEVLAFFDSLRFALLENGAMKGGV